MAKKKALCCTDNLLVLMVSGVFVSLLGLVLLILYLITRGITSSLHLVESHIPTYIAALLTITAGILAIVLVKKRHILLIGLSILLSVTSFIVCVVQAVFAGLVSIPFLDSFSVCVLRATTAECQCYVFEDGNTNSSVLVPGSDTKHITFRDAKSCTSIESSLKEFLYTLYIVYCFTAFGCAITGILSTLLLRFGRESSNKEEEGEETNSRGRSRPHAQLEDECPSRHHPAQSQRGIDTATSPMVSAGHARETTAQMSPQGRQPPGGSSRGAEGRPVRRSVSVTTPQSSSGHIPSGSSRPAARYNSVSGTGDGGSRQRPAIPLLVRGGYLQSHVNGPRIPVFTIQGSNEAYIALTDLPKLQLPALNQVPAYVRDVPELPNYEPPPYSPVPETLVESPELSTLMPSSDSLPVTVRQRLSFEAITTSEQERDIAESQTYSSVTVAPESQLPQAPTDDDEVAVETASFIDDLQSNAEPSQPIVLATDDITIHEGNASDLDDGSQLGTNSQRHLEGEINLAMDSQTPDILMEVIESARSSLNASAVNALDESSSSDSESNDHHLSQLDIHRSSQKDEMNDLNVPSSNPSTDTVNPGEIPSSSYAPGREHVINVGTDRRQKQEQIHLSRVPSTSHVKRNIPSKQSFKHAPALVLLPNSPTGGQRGELPQEPRSKDHGGPKPKNIQRSKSLSSAQARSKEKPVQPIPSSSKPKRYSASYDREKKAAYDRRAAAYYVNVVHDRADRQYDVRNTHKRADKVRSPSASNVALHRPQDASSSENLSDIISLVERVHSTSPKRSSKHKKKRSSGKRDGVFESKM